MAEADTVSEGKDNASDVQPEEQKKGWRVFKWIKEKIIVIAAKRAVKKLDLEEGTAMDTKKWYKSKGVWTGIITVVVGGYETVKASLAPQFGWTLPDIPPIVFTILGALGVYARAVAKSTVTK